MLLIHTILYSLAILAPTAKPTSVDTVAARPACAPVLPYYWADEVKGTNTVDYTSHIYPDSLDYYDYEITASGNGSNKLTVKFQVKLQNGSWSDNQVWTLKPGQTSSGYFRIPNTGPGNEVCRFRVSRKLGTKRIDWTISFTFKC